MHALLRRTSWAASSKVFVTTPRHEQFLSQAALGLTAIVAFVAVLVISALAVLIF